MEGIAEGVIPGSKLPIKRRDFLKLVGLGGGLYAAKTILGVGYDYAVNGVDRLAEYTVRHEATSRAMDVEFSRGAGTLEELGRVIRERTDSLGGVEKSCVCLFDKRQEVVVPMNMENGVFMPASVIKIVICYEAWKAGQRDGKEYLTEEVADQILHRSWTYEDLAVRLPIARGRGGEELEAITRDILDQARIPAANELGELPLKVRMGDLFNYLKVMEMPAVMKRAMVQTDEDKGSNYGVADVLLKRTGEESVYFKLGLVIDDQSGEEKMVNSYYFQYGDELRVLGFAVGSKRVDVHMQMLIAAAATAEYANRKMHKLTRIGAK